MSLNEIIERLIKRKISSGKIKHYGFEKIPKKGPAIITLNHPRRDWYEPAEVLITTEEIVGRRPKFLTSKNVKNFCSRYKATMKYFLKNTITKLTAPISVPLLAVSVIPVVAATIPYVIKKSGSAIYVSNNHEGCSKEGLKEMMRCLKNGQLICVYVKGTTHNEDEELGRLKGGAAHVAYKLFEKEGMNIPIFPGYINGTKNLNMNMRLGEPLFSKDNIIEGDLKKSVEKFTENIRKSMESLTPYKRPDMHYASLEQRA